MATLFMTDTDVETLATVLNAEVARVEDQLTEWRHYHRVPSEHEDNLTLWLHDLTQLRKTLPVLEDAE
jgi:hypothetical protein